MIVLSEFKHDDWIKIFDGKWSLLSSSHFIEQYTKEIFFGGNPFESQSIIFVSKGRSAGWMRQSDRDTLGDYLSTKIVKNPSEAKRAADELKSQSTDFLRFIDRFENTEISEKRYKDFWNRLLKYYKTHIYVKYVVDYLDESLLNKYLNDLEEARLAAEPVLVRTEDFLTSFAKKLQINTGYDYKLILTMTKSEIFKFLSTKKLPQKSDLKKRYLDAVLISDTESFGVFIGSSVKKTEAIVNQKIDTSSLKGMTAYPGKIKGVVKVIFDPQKVHGFVEGDVLVTGATRPEFLPIMKKASAFVTDSGGILAHAAITAREMKKPCVIGTKHATKIFKDGDLIEVDADKGVIRKI